MTIFKAIDNDNCITLISTYIRIVIAIATSIVIGILQVADLRVGKTSLSTETKKEIRVYTVRLTILIESGEGNTNRE